MKVNISRFDENDMTTYQISLNDVSLFSIDEQSEFRGGHIHYFVLKDFPKGYDSYFNSIMEMYDDGVNKIVTIKGKINLEIR